MKKSLPVLLLLTFICFQHLAAQNVGIGTTSPVMRLHVQKADSAVMLLENTQTLAADRGNALYFKTGSYYTGAVKTTGTGTALSRVGIFSYAASNPNLLREYLSVADNGNVGINAVDPGYKLDVNGRMRLRYNALAGNGTAGIWFNKQDNSEEAVFAGNFNDSTYGIYGNSTGWRFYFNHQNGNMGIGISNPRVDLSFPAATGKKISFYPGSNGDVGVGVYGNEFRLHTDYSGADITFGYDTYNAAFTERMRIKGSGQVCIGTNTPATGYLLSVNGKVIAEEVRVQLKGNWPDYVFSSNYVLRPLPVVQQYIQQHQHLPGIPAAEEVAKGGIAVGEMQQKMMEKIEELTLYIINLQEQISTLKKQVDAQK